MKCREKKPRTSTILIIVLMYFYIYFVTSHPQDNTEEDMKGALPEVIMSLTTVSINGEEVGKCWLCLLRLWSNSFLCFYLLIDNILENLRVVDKVL